MDAKAWKNGPYVGMQVIITYTISVISMMGEEGRWDDMGLGEAYA